MAIDTGAYYYLFDPAFQIENNNGKPVVGGHVEVYEAGTDNKVITCQDWDGTVNPFKIPLKSDGRAVILVDIGRRYDAYAYDSFGNLVFSRLNILPLTSGNVSVKGLSKVFHDSTLSGDGTATSPLKVIGGGGGGMSTVITQWPVTGNGSTADPVTIKDITLLANDDTLTSYTATVEGKESLVIGVNSEWFDSATTGFQTKAGMSNYVTNNTLLTQVNNLNGKINTNTNSITAINADLPNKLYTSAFNNAITAYALSADVYSKSEVDEKLANFGGFEVVEGDSEGKPIVADPSTKIIYLVQATTGKPDNYKEWIYDTDWHMIGDTTIDLTNYATKDFVTGITNNKLDTSAFDNTITAYALKTDIPVVPTNVGAFTNDVGYLTAHQSLAGYMEESKLEYNSDNQISGYNGSAFAAGGNYEEFVATFGVTTRGEIEEAYNAGKHIKLIDPEKPGVQYTLNEVQEQWGTNAFLFNHIFQEHTAGYPKYGCIRCWCGDWDSTATQWNRNWCGSIDLSKINNIDNKLDSSAITAYATNDYVSGNYALKTDIPSVPVIGTIEV